MKRSTLILLGVLVVLVAATWLVLREPGESNAPVTTGKTLVDFDSAAIDRIDLRSRTVQVVLEKQNAEWMITSPLRYKADDAGVARALSAAKGIELKTLVSDNPGKQSVFEVDSAAPLVTLSASGAEKAAFRLGKPSTSYTETYVRREGSDNVYLANGVLSGSFSKTPKDWRDKTIFRTAQEGVTNVQFQYGDTAFALAFQDSAWRIGNDKVADGTVRSFLGTLCSLQTDDFIDTALTSPPNVMATLEVQGVSIRFLYDKSTNKYLVQTSQSPQWFEVQGWKASQILKRKKDFVPAAT